MGREFGFKEGGLKGMQEGVGGMVGGTGGGGGKERE